MKPVNTHHRFWKKVTVREEGGVCTPLLDGRVIRLPGGNALAVASRPLAEGIAAEWAAIGVGESGEGAPFTPDDLPLTRISGSMIERIRPDPARARETLLELGLHDALCYRDCRDFGPGPVLSRVFAWLEGQGIAPVVTEGVMPVAQPGSYVEGVRRLLDGADEAALAALGVLAQGFGSLLLALALLHGMVSLEEAVALANEDEARQEAVWGPDDELTRAMALRARDAGEAMRFLSLARDPHRTRPDTQ